jgi:hypothetical protein
MRCFGLSNTTSVVEMCFIFKKNGIEGSPGSIYTYFPIPDVAVDFHIMPLGA